MTTLGFVQPYAVSTLDQGVPNIQAGDGGLRAQAPAHPLTQQAPQTYNTAPLAQAQDPRSQYLTAALRALQQSAAQNAPRTPMALGSDLLAEALDRYGLAQQSRQQQQQAFGQQLGQDFNDLQARNQAFATNLPDRSSAPNVIQGF